LLPTLFAACTHSDAPNADPPSETTDPAVTESSGPATSSGEPSTESSGDQTTTSNESTVDSTGAGVDTLPSAADDEIFAVQYQVGGCAWTVRRYPHARGSCSANQTAGSSRWPTSATTTVASI